MQEKLQSRIVYGYTIAMKRLIIDTSSKYCILAVAEQDRILNLKIYLHENSLSRSLVPEIVAMISPNTLTAVAVGVGPGSYTGTRVGVTVAKSLSFALHIPLRGFCSLIAFLPPRHGTFASILAAKSGQSYLLKGHKHPSRIDLHRAELVSSAQLLDAVKDVDFVVDAQDTPDVQNILDQLLSPPTFPFEKETQPVYLHLPT